MARAELGIGASVQMQQLLLDALDEDFAAEQPATVRIA